MLENKDNVIPFPTERRKSQMELDEARQLYYIKANHYDDCVELARYCIDLLQTGIHEQDFIENRLILILKRIKNNLRICL